MRRLLRSLFHIGVPFRGRASKHAAAKLSRRLSGAERQALLRYGIVVVERSRTIHMHYVYILRSISHPKRLYIGCTQHIEKRLIEHNRGASAWSLDACLASRKR